MAMMVDDERMCDRIRRRRIELHLKQAQLARLLDISGTQMYRYETGRRTPEGERLAAIARVLKKPVSWFRNED